MSTTLSTPSSIRIADMPDLGAVTDTSSVVGEHAGSGRFTAPALRTYCLASLATGDITADSFSATSGYFYAGTSPASTSYIGYDVPSSTWIVAQGGHQNLTVGSDGTVTARGPVSAYGKLMAAGPTTVSMSLYNTDNSFGAGFWVTEANHIWFGQTTPAGIESVGWGYLTQSNLTFQSMNAAIYVGGAQPLCSGDANNFYVPNNAYKPGGGPWSASSDARIKTVQGDYTAGLEEILALRPVRYRYKDNWQRADGFAPAPDAAIRVGLVAQEVEDVMPEMVSQTTGTIDGAEVNDMRMLDTTALPYALLNAIRELNERITELAARLEELGG